MNYIKTTIEKNLYRKVQKVMGKYLLQLCPVTINDMYIVAQMFLDHEPTEEEFTSLETEYIKEALPLVKEGKVAAIIEYDKSPSVNSFSLSGNDMWLSLEERKNMRQSLIALKAQGVTPFTYWLGLTPITMSVDMFEQIMNAVEVYALQCFNVTAQHKANVMALSSLQEVSDYDYTVGYPEKLSF